MADLLNNGEVIVLAESEKGERREFRAIRNFGAYTLITPLEDESYYWKIIDVIG